MRRICFPCGKQSIFFVMIKSSESLILQNAGTQDSTEVIPGQRKPALRLLSPPLVYLFQEPGLIEFDR